jgi:hypothetical protein
VDLPSRKIYLDNSIEYLNLDAFQQIMPHPLFEMIKVDWKHLPRYSPGDLDKQVRYTFAAGSDALAIVTKGYELRLFLSTVGIAAAVINVYLGYIS